MDTSTSYYEHVRRAEEAEREQATAHMQRTASRCLDALIRRGWVSKAEVEKLREAHKAYRAATTADDEHSQER